MTTYSTYTKVMYDKVYLVFTRQYGDEEPIVVDEIFWKNFSQCTFYKMTLKERLKRWWLDRKRKII